MIDRTIKALQALAERGATEGERRAAENALAGIETVASPAVDIAALAGKAYYFGAWGGPGHYLFSPSGNSGSRSVGPWRRLDEIDGMLTPKRDRAHGADAIHHRDGWTAWAMHDYSQDHRGGSNSVLFSPGTHDRATMQAIAEVAFPSIVRRILTYDDSVNGGQSR